MVGDEKMTHKVCDLHKMQSHDSWPYVTCIFITVINVR